MVLTTRHRFAIIVGAVTICVVSSLFISRPATAQSATVIKYGDTVSGELTASVAAIEYQFKGQKGDFAAISIQNDNSGGNLSVAAQIKSDDGTPLANTDEAHTIVFFGVPGEAVLVELPTDGDYTISATHRKSASTENTIGKFHLSLIQAKLLTASQTFKDKLMIDATNQYRAIYAVKSVSDFTIKYEQTGGDFAPLLSVQSVDPASGTFIPQAEMEGGGLKSGTLNIGGNHGLFAVTLSGSDYNESSTNYTLTLLPTQ